MAVLGGALLYAFIFLLPETLVPPGYDPTIHEKITTMSLVRGIPGVPRKKYNPIQALGLLFYPSVFLCLLARIVTFLGLVTLTTTLSRDMISQYGFSTLGSGAAYIASGGGQLLGSILGGYNVDRLMEKARRKMGVNSKPVPESRLLSPLQVSPYVVAGLK